MVIPILLTLCGCGHKTEVRDKGFVRTIGCDNGITQSAAVQLYGSDKTLSGSGETIYTALENAESTQGKTLFTGHLELLVLSPGDIRDKLSVMIKNNRISPSCSILLTPENAAGTVSGHKENELSDLLGSAAGNGKILRKNISEALNDLLEEDALAAVPVIKGDTLTMCVTDGKTISGILSEEESEGLCWLKGGLRDLYMPIEANGRSASFHVDKSSTRISAESDGDALKITTEIKINGGCSEEGITAREASKAAAERVSGLCSKAISKTVTGLRADVFGIKKLTDSRLLTYGERWEDIIPRLQFYYSIKISNA